MILDSHTIVTGAVRSATLAYLVASIDNLDSQSHPHTRIFQWDAGRVVGFTIDWTAHSATVCQFPTEQLLVVGEAGIALIVGQGELQEEALPADPDYFDENAIREVRTIDRMAYATGLGRDVYRRDAPQSWTAVGPKWANEGEIVGFESIHGYSAEELYAVGWSGEICTYDGRRWKQLNSPTNLVLTRVLCAPDGYVYACGQAGILLRGRSDTWEVIEQNETSGDFLDLEYFDGRLYISTMNLLYALDGEEQLRLVDFNGEIPATCHQLSSADGVLWSIGEKDVVVFDGQVWKPLRLNEGQSDSSS